VVAICTRCAETKLPLFFDHHRHLSCDLHAVR